MADEWSQTDVKNQYQCGAFCCFGSRRALAYTMNNKNDMDIVVCLDSKTSKEIWKLYVFIKSKVDANALGFPKEYLSDFNHPKTSFYQIYELINKF